MSFELKPDESVARGARRILRHQVESALELITDPADADEAVHDARKHFKKVRAVLRLMRGALRPKDYRRENLCFRDAARPLTEMRDAVVLVESLDKLAHDFPGEIPGPELDRVRRQLTAHAEAEHQRVLIDGEAFAHVAQTLRDALPRLDDL